MVGDGIAEQLVGYGIDEKKADREAIARVILEAARGVLPLIRLAGPDRRKRLTRELRRMLEAYLAGYIDN